MKARSFLLALIAIDLCGCASFRTVQTERRFSDTGKLENEIVTRASSRTFFDSKSSLANFSATQSEKTQSAKVGSLNQEATGANAVGLIQAIEGVVRAARPTP